MRLGVGQLSEPGARRVRHASPVADQHTTARLTTELHHADARSIARAARHINRSVLQSSH